MLCLSSLPFKLRHREARSCPLSYPVLCPHTVVTYRTPCDVASAGDGRPYLPFFATSGSTRPPTLALTILVRDVGRVIPFPRGHIRGGTMSAGSGCVLRRIPPTHLYGFRRHAPHATSPINGEHLYYPHYRATSSPPLSRIRRTERSGKSWWCHTTGSFGAVTSAAVLRVHPAAFGWLHRHTFGYSEPSPQARLFGVRITVVTRLEVHSWWADPAVQRANRILQCPPRRPYCMDNPQTRIHDGQPLPHIVVGARPAGATTGEHGAGWCGEHATHTVRRLVQAYIFGQCYDTHVVAFLPVRL